MGCDGSKDKVIYSEPYFETKAYAMKEKGGKIEEHTIKRRAPGPRDVHLEIKYAGICHSDISICREEFGPALFPIVPGHEISGVVKSIGNKVTKFKVGDHVGVGCYVDTCRECNNCKADKGSYCRKGMVMTYNSKMKYPHCGPGYNEDSSKQEITYGGYSKDIVVDMDYVCKVPKNLPLEAAAPLMCAGITVFSPMKFYGVKKGDKLAVAGLGGVGSMAVKFGVAMGCHVTVLSRGTKKKEEAMSRLGAHDYVDVTNPEDVAAHQSCYNHMIDTIAVPHDIHMYFSLLDIDGQLIMVGVNPKPMEISSFAYIAQRKSLCGTFVGGVKECQEMLNFCGKNNITCDVEVIKPDYINEAYERTMAADVKYRFSIDVT